MSWRIRPDTSVFHAAAAVSRGKPLINRDLAAALEDPVAEIDDLAKACGVTTLVLWDATCGSSVMSDALRDTVDLVHRKAFGARISRDRVDDLLRELVMAGRPSFLDLAAELGLRKAPLEMQWRARGNGLLLQMSRLTDERIIPPNADVAVVSPVTGGGGGAHLDHNSIRLEAVYADPDPELPEVVRIAWLIGQLQLDLPVFCENLNRLRLPIVSAMALLPPTLAAAEYVELVTVSESLIQSAVRQWIVREKLITGLDAASLAHIVAQWWETYQTRRPPWHVALAALDRLLDGVSV